MRNYSRVCPDANFVVNGLRQVGRYESEIAAQWETWARERTTLVGPSLLLIELTNVFYQLERAAKIMPQEATRLLDAATLIPFEIVDDPTIHQDSLAIARGLGQKATYDAHYVAVARRERIPLFTSDGRLVNALGSGIVETVFIPFENVYR